MAELKIKVQMDIDGVTETIERMAQHFETAPDDDPAKQAMAAFGEIDPETHLVLDEKFEGGVLSIEVRLCPELQRIADMTPV